MEFVTAGSVVSQAAVQLGLVGATVADPFASTDPNLVRLCSLLGSFGQELRGQRIWNYLRQTYLFSTVLGGSLYARAPDFDRYIDQTGWNRTNRLPLGGPLSPQDRELLKALLVGVTFNVLFDLVGQNFRTYPDVTSAGGFLIAYEYASLWWVQKAVPVQQTSTAYALNAVVTNNGNPWICVGAGTTGPGAVAYPYSPALVIDGGVTWAAIAPWAVNTTFSKTPGGANFTYALANGSVYQCTTSGTTSANGMGPSERGSSIPDGGGGAGTPVWSWAAAVTAPSVGGPTASADVCWYDQPLLVKGLKIKYRDDKGWVVTQRMADDYDAALANASSADTAGKALSLHRQSGGNPLIGSQNVPITNFGQPV